MIVSKNFAADEEVWYDPMRSVATVISTKITSIFVY